MSGGASGLARRTLLQALCSGIPLALHGMASARLSRLSWIDLLPLGVVSAATHIRVHAEELVPGTAPCFRASGGLKAAGPRLGLCATCHRLRGVAQKVSLLVRSPPLVMGPSPPPDAAWRMPRPVPSGRPRMAVTTSPVTVLAAGTWLNVRRDLWRAFDGCSPPSVRSPAFEFQVVQPFRASPAPPRSRPDSMLLFEPGLCDSDVGGARARRFFIHTFWGLFPVRSQ